MHGIGATDEQVARLFQHKAAYSALVGSLAGGAFAGLVLIILAAAGGSSLAGELAGRSPLGAIDLLILAAVPIAAIVLATLVARLAVLGALRQAP
jgi:cell division transport system permease protein